MKNQNQTSLQCQHLQYAGKEKILKENKVILILGIVLVLSGSVVIRFENLLPLPNYCFVMGIILTFCGVFYVSSFGYKYGRYKHQQDVGLT